MSIPSDNPILLARDLGPGEGAPAYSLAVGDGEIVALTGTALDVEASAPLLRRLAGAETAEGGLWLKGEPLHTLRPAVRLRFSHTNCAVLPQAVKLLPELSVVENTALPLLLTGLGRHEARRRALRWLERLDVVACADWRIDELSPGELRRVAIARALVTEPTVLLAEEPMAGLGTAERFHLMRILRAAAGTHRLTVIVATSAEDVARWADRRVPLPKAVVPRATVTESVVAESATAEAATADEPAATAPAGSVVSVTSQSADSRAVHGMRHRLVHAGRHRAAGTASANTRADALVGERTEAGVG